VGRKCIATAKGEPQNKGMGGANLSRTPETNAVCEEGRANELLKTRCWSLSGRLIDKP